MNKNCGWKKPFYINIMLFILLSFIIFIIVIISFKFGKNIKGNDLFCGLLGTFIGIFFALIFDRLIEKFKLIKTYKNWLLLLKKELTPLLKMENNSNIQFVCLHNLVNSSDFAIFINNEDLLVYLYNLNIELENFKNGKQDRELIDSIKNNINQILTLIK